MEEWKHKHLTLFSSGNQSEDSWATPDTKSDFFYGKGTIVSLLERLGLQVFQETIENNDFFEGMTFKRDKKTIS